MTNTTGLIVAIIQPEDANGLLAALAAAGCGATYLTAKGGFLDRHAVAVLTLTPDALCTTVVSAIRATCSKRTALVTPVAEAEFGYVPEPIEVEIGGAVLFHLHVASIGQWGLKPAMKFVPGSSVASGQILPGTVVLEETNATEEHMVDTTPSKLIVAIVPDRVAGKVIAALVDHRYGATSVGSTGGFLKRGNTTILSGVPASAADDVAGLIETTCQRATDGGAEDGGVVFALDVDWRLRV